MLRLRVLALAVSLVAYGAVSARQPALRASVPLPAPAADVAQLLGLPFVDRSRIVLDIVRLLFDAPEDMDADDMQMRAKLTALFDTRPSGETVPLPLDPSIWRDAILARQVPDEELLAAILSDRGTALLYYALAALDDETLGALGADPGLLQKLVEHAGTFAGFGRSLRVKGGRVDVPGGPGFERLWEEIVGAPVSDPSSFARRLFGREDSRLAFFYDTIAHLEPAQQRFALSGGQVGRVRALAEAFERSAVELRANERPFWRLYADPSLTLAAIEVTANGMPKGPAARELWDVVFKDSERLGYQFQPARVEGRDSTALDAAWIVGRIHRHSAVVAQRRRDAFLFAQRVFTGARQEETAAVATALRGVISFPTLLLALERAGVASPAVMAAAAVRADAINQIGAAAARRIALMQFQGSLGILERMVLSGGLTPPRASAAVSELVAIDLATRDAPAALGRWISRHLAASENAEGASAESRLLSRMAGVSDVQAPPVTVEWEGRTYRVNPAEAELQRLVQVRERQRGPSLDDALSEVAGPAKGAKANGGDAHDPGQRLGEVLASIVYAAHLGEPDGSALAAGNVALRHEFGLQNGTREASLAPWRIALESFGGPGGWRLSGSLLGLEAPLARFALRRLDTSVMPAPPTLTANERYVASLTAALLRPNLMSDDTRDDIAAALERGRERVAALTSDRGRVDEIARDAGMSGWRREALAWTIANQRERASEHFAPLDLFWLGTAGQDDYSRFNPWGAAATPVSGCFCLVMPRPGPWESFAGRPAMGVLAARGADVNIVVAEALSRMRLPATLAPGVAAFAIQDVLDATLPAYFDDWSPFGRAAAALPQERLVDYVAALTAGGPLFPLPSEPGRSH